MKKRKVIYSVILGVLIMFVLFIYNAFNGNPLSKFYSTNVLETYLEQTYSDREFRVEEGFYNFKSSTYDFNVIEIGNTSGVNGPNNYEFTVSGFLKPQVRLDSIYIENLDEPLMEKLSTEAEHEITNLLKQHVPAVRGINVYLEVQKGQYESEATWHKDMKLEKPISLFIVLDSTTSTKEDILTDAEVIQKMLKENNYHYESVTINGNILDETNTEFVKDQMGYVKYYVSFESDTVIKLKDIEELN